MTLYETTAGRHPKLARGQVWCWNCGATMNTDSAEAMQHGLPKCCGDKMRLESGDISKPVKR